MTTPTAETLARVEVLADLEEVVHELMVQHEAKRILWFPSELLAPPPETDPLEHLRTLRELAEVRPQSVAQLQEIYGIGPAKAARYGEALLDVVRAQR